jgi:TolB-like protein/DNA-binding winged helix-turn-helix (wHTH) protein/Tfp pilus assembly protein PilF
MPAHALTPSLLRFADFEVDLRAGELFRLGNRVRIQQLPFQLLVVLLQHAGELVTREELSQQVWPANTFVDFDHGLAVAVHKLRDALGDSSDQPRFVETVGRRGYRFLLPVEAVARNSKMDEEGAALLALGLSSQAATRDRSRQRPAVAIVGVLALAAVALLLLHSWQSPAGASAPPHIYSIAVLPLENLSNDPEQEYFVEGMTDEIITDLAKLPGLRVISRTSSMHYQNTRKTLPEIARELNVDGVVEGTVVRLGDRVRIRTQLIYAPSDQHLWAEAYERDVKDVLALQANLAGDIASEIRLKLTAQQQAQLTALHSVDPKAHELYLKGRYFWNKRNEAGFAKAVEYFQQAITTDPTYAEAYAGLADTYALLGKMPEAKTAAEKALELNSDLAEAHASLGLIAPFVDWNWAEAKRHFERAIMLNPSYATAHHWYGEVYLMPNGRTDEAIAEIRKAQELDPLSPVIMTDLGKDLYLARRYEEAVVELRRALEIDPSFISAHNWLSDTFLEQGKYAEAIAELEQTKPFKEERIYVRQTAYLYARMGRRAEGRRALARSLQLSEGKSVSLGAVALCYAALGEKDKAFLWLEKAYAERSSFMTTLKYWSVFDPIRSDPRFADLVKRTRLQG